MPKSWKGLDGSRLWCIFPDGRCHFVFCINWLNLLALCTYFRGNHSLLSIGQKRSLALEPSWSGEGGTTDCSEATQASPNTSSAQTEEGTWAGALDSRYLRRILTVWTNQTVSYAEELSRVILPICPSYLHGGQIGSLCSYFNSSISC